MDNPILIAIYNTAIVMFLILAVGLLIGGLKLLLTKLLVNVFGANFADFFLNKFTFIGVVHHELSHALFAILTGAKVVEIHLFKIEEDSLGKMVYISRGIFLTRCIQDFLTAIAPTVCGGISIFCMIYFIPFNAVWQYIVFGFLILCIFIHMEMSIQDIKVGAKGIPILLIIIFCVFYFTKVDLISIVANWIKGV